MPGCEHPCKSVPELHFPIFELKPPKICFLGTESLRATSVMVLFLVFLQKGSFVSYLGSTIVKAVFRQAHDHKNLVRIVTEESRGGRSLGSESDNDEDDLVLH